MANNTKAKIPTQNNLVNVIKAEIEASNDIMKIIIDSAKKCEKYEKVKGELESYNNTIKFIFGENGLLVSLNSINNFNGKKINQGVNDLKKIISNLSELILHISKELNNSSTVINSIDIIAFNTLYFNFISKINELFNIVNKFEFNLLLNIKLYFIIWQINIIKNFIEKAGNSFKEISSNLIIMKSLLFGGTGISLIKIMLESITEMFDMIYNFKFNFIKLYIKLKLMALAINMILNTIKDISKYGNKIDYSSVIKSMICLSYLTVILNVLKNIFITVNTIKIGIKFYLKLFFIKIALKHIFDLIKTISKYNNVNIDFRVVSSFLFTLIILKFTNWIFASIRDIKIGVLGSFRLINKIKTLTKAFVELLKLIETINKISINANNIKQIDLIVETTKKLKFIFKDLNSIKVKLTLLKKIQLIKIVLNKFVKLIDDLNKLKINKSIIGKNGKLTIISEIVKQIKTIILNVSLLGVMAIVGIIALIPISLFVISLSLLIWSLHLLFKLINLIIRPVRNGLKKILFIFTSLMLIGVSMLLLAAAAPIVLKAALAIIVLLGIILITVGAIWLAMNIIENLTLKAAKKALKTTIYLIIIAGLFAVMSVSLLLIAFIGILLLPLIGYIISSIIVITIFIFGIIGLSKILNKFNKDILKAVAEFTLIITAIALLTGVAAMLLVLGGIGEKISTGNTASNILIAVGCVTCLIIAIVGLGMLLTWAMGFISLTTANLALVVISALAILGLSYLLLKLGEIGSTMKDNNTAENVHELLCTISKVGWRLAGLGAELIIIGASCLLLNTFIEPFLNALTLVATAGTQLIKLSEKEIDIEIISKNINHIRDVWDTYKDFAKSFKIKDMLLMHTKANAITSTLTTSISAIYNIADKLNKIKDINFNETQKKDIMDSVKNIFDFVKDLEDRIKTLLVSDNPTPEILQVLCPSTLKFGAKMNEARIEKLNSVDKVVSSLKNITDSLNSLQKITLNKGKIESNINNIFKTIDDIALKIQQSIMGEKESPIDKIFAASTKWVWHEPEKWYQDGWWEAVPGDNETVKRLNNVDKIASVIGNVMKTIESLSKVNLDETAKTNINNNISNAFKFIDQLAVKVSDFLTSQDNAAALLEKNNNYNYNVGNQELLNVINNKTNFDSNVERMAGTSDNISKVVTTISNVMETIKKLSSFSLKQKDINDIKNNIETLFDTTGFIIRKVQQQLDENKVENPESIQEKLEPILSSLERLNTGFESLGNTDTKAFKNNVNVFGTFVESINKVNVEKVEKTTKLFEKMSELTANMKGDFDKVADALTEKLLPVLEDLKLIMVDVPEKLDKGFSNTSASIAAVNQPPTMERYVAQQYREEPNISQKEAERKAMERINEKAQAEANGIAAKLDELISLFKGMGADTAIVRTI